MSTLHPKKAEGQEDSAGMEESVAEASDRRIPYTSPRLTVHGCFQRITLDLSQPGDTGDPPPFDDE